MKKTLLSLFVIVFSFAVSAQHLKENTADKYYAALAFEKCAPMYADLAKKEKATTDIIRKAADSYRMLNNTKKTEQWYGKLLTKSDIKPIDHYNYAQSLLGNGKYTEANDQMHKFYDKSAANTVAKRYYSVNPNYEKELKKDSSKFIIKPIDYINSTESEFSPAYLTMTELIYTTNKENHGAKNTESSWDNTSFLDLYKVNIDTATQTATKPKIFDKAFKSSFHDGPIAFSHDGKTLLLTRSNYYNEKVHRSNANIVNIQLYYATKNGDKWSDLKPCSFNNKEYNYGHACFSSDDKTVYFVSDMPGTFGSTDIWQTTFENNTFTEPKNLGQEINTEGREMFPFMDSGDLLLFASDGHVGLGGLDIHLAKVNAEETTYISNVGYPINTRFDDFSLVYDPATLKGFLASNRNGGKGKDDIYAFKMAEPFIQKIYKGKVIDELSKDPIPFATVKIINKKGETERAIKANEKGEFSLLIQKGSKIKAEVQKDNYVTYNTYLVSFSAVPVDVIEIPLRKQEFGITAVVKDAVNRKLLDGVEVTIVDAITQKDAFVKLTGEEGSFALNLNEKLSEEKIKYIVDFKREGYETKHLEIEKTKAEMLNGGILTLDILLNPNTEAGGVLALNPIYFDLNKSEIREDAKNELNKLAEALNRSKEIIVEITSGTDCRASDQYNMALSQRRAKSTALYIINKGINRERLKIKWTGENNLAVNCPCGDGQTSSCSEEQHQQNRRSDFKIIGSLNINKITAR